MKWYNYLACFFMGVFLVNSFPHILHGISGDAFPTPFANPPGKGHSAPWLNVLWGLVNMSICYLLYISSRISRTKPWSVALFLLGFVAMSFELSRALSLKM